MTAPSPPRPMTTHEHIKATRPMRWWYESLADFMIANPAATQNEIAAHFGRTAATISTIIHTDAFKAYYRQRRDVHTERLDAGVRDKLFRLADKSLDQMLATLEKKRDTIPLESLQRTSDMALKNLGYGVTPAANTTVNVNTQPTTVSVAVSLDDLTRAREALRRNQSAPTIEHNPEEAALEPRRHGEDTDASLLAAPQDDPDTLKDLA